MKKIFIDDKHVAIFSDIHFGKSRDSIMKLKVAEDYIDWFIQNLQKRNIKTVFHLGDLFNNRNSISLKTLFSCYNCIKKFSDNGIKLFLVVGNHDMYMKEDDEINSIAHYKEIPKVEVIENATEIEFSKSNTTGVIFPFVNKEEHISQYLNKNYSIAFGHFEFNGAILNCNENVNQHGINFDTISDLANTVFSGHFHICKEYATKNGKIICVGCPNELDWGDYGDKKRFAILDTETMNYEFIYNDFSPIHVKIFWSDIKKGNKKNFDKIYNNYIKLIVDTEYEFEKIIKIVNFINAQKPIRSCEVEYLYNVNFNSDFIHELEKDDEKKLEFTHIDYMNKFIDDTPKEQIKDLDSSIIKNIVNSYYSLATVNN